MPERSIRDWSARRLIQPRRLSPRPKQRTVISSVLFFVWVAASFAPQLYAQLRDFNNRIEGTEIPHGDADMQLLGVLRSSIVFTPASTLHAVFFLPSNSQANAIIDTGQVVVEAREIVPTRNYFMRSKAAQWRLGSWNDFGPWPTADVIDPQGIQPTNFAIAASYSMSDGSRVYLPVELLASKAPSSTAVYTVQFSTAYELHSLDVTLTSPSGVVQTLPSAQCPGFATCTLFEADSSQSLTIDLQNRAPGIYQVHLVGHVPGSTLHPELSIKIYHQMR